nr:4-coumarate--CoA ligase-like isoform X1 [Procambarus clarkii]
MYMGSSVLRMKAAQQQQQQGAADSSRARTTPRLLQWQGTEPLPAIPDTNYAAFVLEIMAGHGDAVAVVEAETGRQRTYREVCGLVPRVSAGLAAAGVVPGDAVLFVTPTIMDYPLVLLSIVHRGATCVPVNANLSIDELVHVVRVSKASWAVVHEDSLEVAEAAFSLMPPGTLRQLWVLGDCAPHRPNLTHLITYSPEPPFTKAEGLEASTAVAMMPFSSGTTGLPKGVMLSHRNLLYTHIRTMYERSLQKRGRGVLGNAYKSVLVMLPVCHIYGHLMVLITLHHGGAVVFLRKFTPRKYLQAIQDFKVTFSPLVPHLVKFLTETPLLKEYDISSVKYFHSGAAPLTASTATSFTKKIRQPIGGGYGMTETSAVICTNRPSGPYNVNSVGKVAPYVQVKVVNVESGELVAEGVEGEVCARGPNIMLGYANDPVATAATIDTDGWLHTGDIGYYDKDDFLYLTDRIKDLIKVKGYQVSPTELENILRKNEGVDDVAVVGVPHEKMGEAPRAYVVPRPGSAVRPHHLQQFLAERVAHYKRLAGGVKLVASIPRNSTGKVLRRQLVEGLSTPAAKL